MDMNVKVTIEFGTKAEQILDAVIRALNREPVDLPIKTPNTQPPADTRIEQAQTVSAAPTAQIPSAPPSMQTAPVSGVPMQTLPTAPQVYTLDMLQQTAGIFAGASDAYLQEDVENTARKIQEEHRESNPLEGLIEEFIERPVPIDWVKMSLPERQSYWGSHLKLPDSETLVQRKRVCALEIWCECLYKLKGDFRQKDAREINQVLETLGWERQFPCPAGPDYGNQRCYARKETG